MSPFFPSLNILASYILSCACHKRTLFTKDSCEQRLLGAGNNFWMCGDRISISILFINLDSLVKVSKNWKTMTCSNKDGEHASRPNIHLRSSVTRNVFLIITMSVKLRKAKKTQYLQILTPIVSKFTAVLALQSLFTVYF